MSPRFVGPPQNALGQTLHIGGYNSMGAADEGERVDVQWNQDGTFQLVAQPLEKARKSKAPEPPRSQGGSYPVPPMDKSPFHYKADPNVISPKAYDLTHLLPESKTNPNLKYEVRVEPGGAWGSITDGDRRIAHTRKIPGWPGGSAPGTLDDVVDQFYDTQHDENIQQHMGSCPECQSQLKPDWRPAEAIPEDHYALSELEKAEEDPASWPHNQPADPTKQKANFTIHLKDPANPAMTHCGMNARGKKVHPNGSKPLIADVQSAREVLQSEDNRKYSNSGWGSANAPFCQGCGNKAFEQLKDLLQPAQPLDWRPNESIPEDHYALSLDESLDMLEKALPNHGLTGDKSIVYKDLDQPLMHLEKVRHGEGHVLNNMLPDDLKAANHTLASTYFPETGRMAVHHFNDSGNIVNEGSSGSAYEDHHPQLSAIAKQLHAQIQDKAVGEHILGCPECSAKYTPNGVDWRPNEGIAEDHYALSEAQLEEALEKMATKLQLPHPMHIPLQTDGDGAFYDLTPHVQHLFSQHEDPRTKTIWNGDLQFRPNDGDPYLTHMTEEGMYGVQMANDKTGKTHINSDYEVKHIPKNVPYQQIFDHMRQGLSNEGIQAHTTSCPECQQRLNPKVDWRPDESIPEDHYALSEANLLPMDALDQALDQVGDALLELHDRPMAKAEETEEGPAHWNHRMLVDPDHVHELEREAAIHEFGGKLPRPEAEHKAYEAYRRKQIAKAAAHHLQGMKASQSVGDHEEMQHHGAMYQMHLQELGHEAIGPVPEEVKQHLDQPSKEKMYKFKAHPADSFLLKGKGA